MNGQEFFYPEIHPYDSGRLNVGEGHILYFEQSGNPRGRPLVCLHGGPGDKISASIRRLFNPEKFRIIQYDQRGCGKSTPKGVSETNTTPHLVADLDKLIRHLKIEKWDVFGGSWGSALALAYADKHPDQIDSMIINGIFLGRRKELDHLYHKNGLAGLLFPDVYEPFYDLLPEEYKNDPVEGYNQLLTSNDSQIRCCSAKAWTRLEFRLSKLDIDDETVSQYLEDIDACIEHALFQIHYFRRNCFMDGDSLLKSLPDKLSGKIVHIIQGRYDMICPLETAWKLHKSLKDSFLHIIPNVGHDSREPSTTRKLVEVLEGL